MQFSAIICLLATKNKRMKTNNADPAFVSVILNVDM